MLKFVPVLLLSLSYSNLVSSHAGYLYGAGLQVYKNVNQPAYEEPVVRFAYASAPILKYGVPYQLRTYETQAPVAVPQIKYTLGAPVTTTTTSYIGYTASPQLATASSLSSFGASGYVASRVAPISIPTTYAAAVPSPLPIFKYAQPSQFAVAALAPPPVAYAASAW